MKNRDTEFKTACVWQNYCVAVKRTDDEVLVRDTKNPDGPVMAFSHNEWATFLGGVKEGKFDL